MPAVERFGKLIPLTTKRIDPSNWSYLESEVIKNIRQADDGDYILLDNSNLVLLLAVTFFSRLGFKLQLLDYDILTKELVLYTLDNENNQWQRTTPEQ